MKDKLTVRRPRAWLLLLLLLCLLGTAQALDAALPTVRIASADAQSGETVELAVTVENNPGILGAKLTFAFESQLTLVSARAGDAFEALTMTSPGQLTSPCSFVWDACGLSDGDIRDGAILYLTFRADSAAKGSYAVSCTYDSRDVVDTALQPVRLRTLVGSVRVKQPKPQLTVSAAVLSGGMLSVTAEAQADVPNAVLRLAAYRADGKYLGCVQQTVSLREGCMTYSIPCLLAGDVLKLFVSDSGGTPLCAAKTVTTTAAEYRVTFADWDGSTLAERTVREGENAALPDDPTREGFLFTGWDSAPLAVRADCTVTAQYIPDTLQPTIYAQSCLAPAGEGCAELTLRLHRNPGLLGLRLGVTYDENALQLCDAVCGDAVADALTI